MSSIFNLDIEPFLLELRRKNNERNEEWTKGADTTLVFRALELGGEVGELLNAIKKIERAAAGWVGSTVTYDDVLDEIADVQICLDRVAEYFSANLETITRAKFNKTSEKYGLKVKM